MSMIDKTSSVRNTVFRAILHGSYQPGSRVPPEREMARLTETSRVTVRRAYDALHAAGILERSQGSGTYVAERSSGNPDASGPVALLAGIDSRFALGFIRALEGAVTRADRLLVLRLTDDMPAREEEAAIELVARGIRNLVLWPSGRGFPARTFARLRVLGVNLVVFDRVLPGDYADFVGLDNAAAMDALFVQAEADGLVDPLFVGHSDLEADSDRAREEAFRRSCSARGLPPRVLLLEQHVPSAALLAPEIRPQTSVFCVNDAMAMALQPGLPAKTRLYGIDGLAETICSYQQPLQAMADAVVELLQRQQSLGDAWTAQHRIFTGHLINNPTGHLHAYD
jgi:DNA-binding LacI/PurR family transcriptional regulator